MVFKIDFINGKAVEWSKTRKGLEAESFNDYNPRFYLEGDRSSLQKTRGWLTSLENVEATKFEEWKPTLSKSRKKVLRIDTKVDELKNVVYTLKKNFDRSKFRFYNVGFSPQFRYCLQKDLCPVPERKLDKIEIRIKRKNLSQGDISPMYVDSEKLGGCDKKVLTRFIELFKSKDPDIILVNRGKVLKLLNNFLNRKGFENVLTRLGGFEKLAGENTVSSYGKTVHSASRFNVPGRIVIDRSNSFMLEEATLEGLWDLVERSYRPLQELAWGSIGRILTSIEVKKAYLEENTLTPWKNWSGENPKNAATLHKADRGGFIFNPDPSIHENVLEADFASLFPNIMIEKNISPETVCCNCCENKRVPELDYSICEEEGFIPKVLKPLVEDRQDMKEELKTVEDIEREKYLEGSIDAIKWILVSCFGYMGHSHASYGAIECHQAIQAFDRDIMVKTKELFEEHGYSVLHGIIDSLWVQDDSSEKDFDEVCEIISEEIGIKLESENRFEWCGFVARSGDSPHISTLNRYFGKKQDGGFKTAGIECEQRTTSEFVKKSQREMIKALDNGFNPENVLSVLDDCIEVLENGDVDIDDLLRKKRVSKSLGDYQVENRSVAAIKRARENGIEVKPGQELCFVVRDDNASSLDRVRLDFEAVEGGFDRVFYRKMLVRACESVLSPLGWDRKDIRDFLDKEEELSLRSFTS